MTSNNKIIIFGAGIVGRNAFNYYGFNKVYCFVDNFKADSEYCGKPVISFLELCYIYEQYDIIIACSQKNYPTIVEQLQSAGINKYNNFADIIRPIRYKLLQEEVYTKTAPSIQNTVDEII